MRELLRERYNMFGMKLKTKCPHCNKEYIAELGCLTHYYQVNDSKNEYTKLKCKLCGNKYWLYHLSEVFYDSIKCDEKDKIRLTSIVNW
jgi:transcription elongation factor Elf1